MHLRLGEILCQTVQLAFGGGGAAGCPAGRGERRWPVATRGWPPVDCSGHAAVVREVVDGAAVGAERSLAAVERCRSPPRITVRLFPLLGEADARRPVVGVRYDQRRGRTRNRRSSPPAVMVLKFGPGRQIDLFMLLCFSHQGEVSS